MKKKVKQIVEKGASAEKIKNIMAPASPLPPSVHNGEYTIDFNKYNVVYSNNVTGNLWSPWRAGNTSIDCYKDDKFVGVISFYETRENMRGGYMGGNGVVVIEYPISEFEDIMRILKTFTNLSLLFVDRDLNGNLLTHPVGAVMTFQMKPIGV
jgi:hypothetical protein